MAEVSNTPSVRGYTHQEYVQLKQAYLLLWHELETLRDAAQKVIAVAQESLPEWFTDEESFNDWDCFIRLKAILDSSAPGVGTTATQHAGSAEGNDAETGAEAPFWSPHLRHATGGNPAIGAPPDYGRSSSGLEWRNRSRQERREALRAMPQAWLPALLRHEGRWTAERR